MSVRKIKDAKDLETNEKIYFVSHAKATFMSNGSSVEDAILKANAYIKVSHGTSDTIFTLTPNVFHVWDSLSTLTLTLGAEIDGIANEYLFQFTCGSTATTLSLPTAVKWAGGEAPTIEASKTYQVSILNNCATLLAF